MRPSRSSLVRPRTLPSLPRAGREAVVLGASMAGLLTAAVLTEAYDHVTLVERDELLGDDEPRRGVPQGRHAHILLPRGAQALEELFPGLLEELVRDGGATSTRLDQLHMDFTGHLLSQDPERVETAAHQQSRPFLEARVLRRLRALPDVSILDAHEVVGLRADRTGRDVVGARVVPRRGAATERDLPADLVVVATGRSGRVGVWLRELGYDAPAEEELKVGLLYATRWARLDRDLTDPLEAMLIGPRPDRPWGVGSFRQEDDVWVVTLAGFAGHHPPDDPEAWLAFAATVTPPRFMTALRTADYRTDVQTHRFPANLRRRFDKLSAFPGGLLVTGDAVCSFNPIYGQGMTVAALEALALRGCLSRGTHDLPRRFFKAASRPVGRAWQFAVGADLSMPPDVVPGPRPLPVRLVNGYIDRYQAAAEGDPVLATHFLNVTGFDEPVRTLFAPSSIGRIVQQRRRRTREDPPLPVISG
jgi:2-polyprenyl-6-methoxyphenol hydroxylase-like FAD-dependent oxidoreductase